MNRRNRIWIRRGLSLLIVFHMAIVLISPVPESEPGKAIGKYAQSYLNFFEFTPNWNFFAPDPGPPPIFAEYELLDGSGKNIGVGKWPEEGHPYFLTDRQSRRVAMARFVIATAETEERLMVPWLCKNKKGDHGEEVRSVRLWKSVKKLPTRAEVVKNERKPAGDDELRFMVSLNFCEKRGKS